MKRNTSIMAAIAFIVSVAAVSACSHGPGWGWGHGHDHMMGPDNRGSGCYHKGVHGQGYYRNLTAEEIKILDQNRAEFLNATKDIRQQLNEKELALSDELAKEVPDSANASRLQNEISKFQSEIDQKWLEYEIQVRKSIPNYNRDCKHHGPMKGYGPNAGRYCRW